MADLEWEDSEPSSDGLQWEEENSSSSVPQLDSQSKTEKGFFGRVGTDLSERANAMGNTSNPIHGVGQVAGGVNDIAQEGLKSWWDAAPENVHESARGIANNLGAWSSEAAKNPIINRFAVQPAKSGMENIDAWKKEYPEATKYAEDVGNIVGAAPLLSSVGKVASFAKDIGSDLIKPAGKDAFAAGMPKAADLKGKASGLYGESAAQNLILEPEQTEKLSKELNSLRPKDSLEAAVWDKSGAQDEANMLHEAMANGPISFNGALAMRSRLNSLITKSFLAKDDVTAAHLQKVRDTLNDTMMDIKNPKWQEANHEFGKGATMQTLEEMVAKASTKAQPSASLDTAINNFLQSRKSAGLKDAERSALEMVVKNSKTDKLKQAAGSGLGKYAVATILSPFGAAGSGAGYILGHYGSAFAKDAAMTNKLEKLDKVYQAINNRPFKGAVESTTETMNPLLLTDQRASTATRKAADAAKGSNAGNVIHGASPLSSEAERFAIPPPNYESPRPVEPKMLPSPTMINPSERQVTPWGSAHPAPYSNQSLRQGAAEVGLTPDVARAQKAAQETNLMQRFAQQKAAEKAAQEAAVWGVKGPEDIKALIDRGMANQQDLSEALGEGFNRNDMTEALLRARQGKSTGGIIKRFKKKQPK